MQTQQFIGAGPIILFQIDKKLKIGLYSAVLPFCLAISLREKSRGEPPFDAKEVAKEWPEFGSE